MLIAVTVNDYKNESRDDSNIKVENLPTHILFKNALSIQECLNAVELITGLPVNNADTDVIPIDKNKQGQLVEPKMNCDLVFDFLKD